MNRCWQNQIARTLTCALTMTAMACGDGGADEDGASAGLSAACGGEVIEAGDHTLMLEHDGMMRSYILHVPPGLSADAPAPLVFNYHGLTSSADQQVFFSNLDATADAEGFMVLYPEGLSASFNAGSCCSNLANPPHEADDVGFTRAILEDIGSQACVDLRRVYSTGMSNGGYMSEYNACKNADIFAAVAPVSAMAFKQSDCEPSRPIPMIGFNGTTDNLVAYNSAMSSIEDWLERNGCGGEPTRTDYGDSYCDRWTDCADGVEMQHCTLTGMGHCWPGQAFCPFGATNTDVDANTEMWAFLSRFELPQPTTE